MDSLNKEQEDRLKEGELTPELANIIFQYDKESGKLYWRICLNSRAPKGREAGFTYKGATTYYKTVKLFGVRYQVHRIIWLLENGHWPRWQIDHIDGNGINNRIKNLRDVPFRSNHMNRVLPSTNTSGVMGVSWSRMAHKWIASITVNQRTLYLGSFDDIQDAARARKQAERQHGFHPNHGRRVAREALQENDDVD